eukprot:360670-Chlamydomonas_euryale.AAC.2
MVAWDAHERSYNAPTADGVAAVVPFCSGSNFAVAAYPRDRNANGNEKLQTIDHNNPYYFPARFPLSYMFGTGRWSPVLRQNGNHGSLHGKKLSLHDYGAFLMSERRNADNVPRYAFSTCRLLQEFAVTAWATVEQQRIQYLMSPAGQNRSVQRSIRRS